MDWPDDEGLGSAFAENFFDGRNTVVGSVLIQRFNEFAFAVRGVKGKKHQGSGWPSLFHVDITGLLVHEISGNSYPCA